MEFKDRIRVLRREAGFTQSELAEKIGVTYRTYQNYEAGVSTPSGKTMSKLSALFGVSMDMLSSREPKSPSPTENRELRALLEEMQALFAGGRVSDDDKKYVIEALTEGYFRSKEINKKYGRKTAKNG